MLARPVAERARPRRPGPVTSIDRAAIGPHRAARARRRSRRRAARPRSPRPPTRASPAGRGGRRPCRPVRTTGATNRSAIERRSRRSSSTRRRRSATTRRALIAAGPLGRAELRKACSRSFVPARARSSPPDPLGDDPAGAHEQELVAPVGLVHDVARDHDRRAASRRARGNAPRTGPAAPGRRRPSARRGTGPAAGGPARRRATAAGAGRPTAGSPASSARSASSHDREGRLGGARSRIPYIAAKKRTFSAAVSSG